MISGPLSHPPSSGPMSAPVPATAPRPGGGIAEWILLGVGALVALVGSLVSGYVLYFLSLFTAVEGEQLDGPARVSLTLAVWGPWPVLAAGVVAVLVLRARRGQAWVAALVAFLAVVAILATAVAPWMLPLGG